jgi:hypothetical protein
MEPAKKLEDLVAWQLASELSDLVDEMVSHPAASRYSKLCDQISTSSAASQPTLRKGSDDSILAPTPASCGLPKPR